MLSHVLIVMLSVFVLSALILKVVLDILMLSVAKPNDVMLNVVAPFLTFQTFFRFCRQNLYRCRRNLLINQIRERDRPSKLSRAQCYKTFLVVVYEFL